MFIMGENDDGKSTTYLDTFSFQVNAPYQRMNRKAFLWLYSLIKMLYTRLLFLVVFDEFPFKIILHGFIYHAWNTASVHAMY